MGASNLSGVRISPLFGRYQIILLGEQRHMCVNNLPKVVTWQCCGSESIRGPFGNQSGPLLLYYQDTCVGNANLHSLTAERRQKLRIDLTDSDKKKKYAEYNEFEVASPDKQYNLTAVGKYKGNAGTSVSAHEICVNQGSHIVMTRLSGFQFQYDINAIF